MENMVNNRNDPDSGIKLREQDFEFIDAAGKRSQLLAVSMAVILGLLVLLGGAFSWLFKRSVEKVSTSPDQSSGFQILKKQTFDVDAGFFIFSLAVFFFWGVVVYLLFRFSYAAKAVSNDRQGQDLTDALMHLSRLFKLLVVGLLGGLGLLFSLML